MARLLLLKGASPLVKNALGDSPIGKKAVLIVSADLSKRYSNHEITMLLNNALAGGLEPSSSGGSGSSTMRKTK